MMGIAKYFLASAQKNRLLLSFAIVSHRWVNFLILKKKKKKINFFSKQKKNFPVHFRSLDS